MGTNALASKRLVRSENVLSGNHPLKLRDRLLPNYRLPLDCQAIEILRVVVKENMTETVCQLVARVVVLH